MASDTLAAILAPRPTLHDEFVAAGCEIDHHESDMYVKRSPAADAIVAGTPWQRRKFFRSERDGALWWEFPFAYSPWWVDRCGRP